MKMTIKHAHVTTRREFDLRFLKPCFRTVQFTLAEVRRIEKAAKICGWKAGEGARCARLLVLRDVAAILRSARSSCSKDR